MKTPLFFKWCTLTVSVFTDLMPIKPRIFFNCPVHVYYESSYLPYICFSMEKPNSQSQFWHEKAEHSETKQMLKKIQKASAAKQSISHQPHMNLPHLRPPPIVGKHNVDCVTCWQKTVECQRWHGNRGARLYNDGASAQVRWMSRSKGPRMKKTGKQRSVCQCLPWAAAASLGFRFNSWETWFRVRLLGCSQ